MGLAETAELAVNLKLNSAAYTAGMKNASSATASFGKTAGAIGGHVSAGVGSAIKNFERLGLVAGGLLVSQIKFGIDSLQRLDDVVTQTNAVIRSTRGAAGESAAAIRDLALKYEDLNAVIDDKVIQSGENLLLTFTAIRKEAFEPTLAAALNLNQALGGGEAGLQGTIIQVGKAMQDPIRGLTALRRVGVAFSADQEKQIKDLVKHNKLYEAQKIILAELTKEFGGSFAAAGQTATGKFASLADAIDDAQQSLATAFLPALTEVAGELSKFLRDPTTIAAIKSFGTQLAGGFKTAFEWAKKLDFASIASGLKSAAGFAGTLVQKFMDAPEWLKTAVITGWGLNKLTGGALTNIGGDIAKGIGSQFLGRGSSPAMPLFVKEIGGLGGAAGAAGAAAGAPVAAIGATFAAIVASPFYLSWFAKTLNPTNDPNNPAGRTFDPAATNANGLLPPGIHTGSRTPNMPGYGQFIPGTGALTTHLGKLADDVAHTARGIEASGAAIGGFTGAVRASAAALRGQAALTKDHSWLATLAKGIHDRSVAKFGGKGLGSGAESATYQRDVLGRARSIDRSSASSSVKLERMKALLHDAKNATDATKRVLSGDIKSLKTQMAHQKPPQVSVSVSTNVQVSANSVVATVHKVARWGPASPNGPRIYEP